MCGCLLKVANRVLEALGMSRHQSGPTPGRLRFAGGAPAELRPENCVVALRHARRHVTSTAPARAIASMYITRPLWPIVAFPSCMLQQSFLYGPNVRPVTGNRFLFPIAYLSFTVVQYLYYCKYIICKIDHITTYCQ
jgi:hypothetical protein